MHTAWSNMVVLGALIGCTSGKDASTDGNTDTGGVTVDTADTSSEDTGPKYTIWSGAPLVFEKPDFGDPTDPANQDAISDLVVLTRGDQDSLFNVVVEPSASPGSPQGTEWAEGTTADLESLTFASLKAAANDQMKSVPDKDFVLHLIEEDIYLDVRFLSWTSGSGGGGGFSYERSTSD